MRFDCTFLEASGVAALQDHPFTPVATPISALQEATLGSDLATPRTCTSAKAGCAERQYTVEQLRLAAHSILSAAKSGKPLAAATAARLQGAPSMRRSLTRLMEQVWALDGPDHDQAGFGLDRWLVRSDYIAAYEAVALEVVAHEVAAHEARRPIHSYSRARESSLLTFRLVNR